MSYLTILRGVGAKIVLLPAIAFVLGLVIPGLLGYQLMLRQAERETHEKALASIRKATKLWIETSKEFGDAIPKPKGRRLVFA